MSKSKSPSAPPASRRALALALAVSAALVISAPYVGDLQRWLRSTLGTSYVVVVNSVVGLVAAAAVAGAALTIRDHVVRRLVTIGLACALAAVYAWWSGLASAESNAVERFHFIEYGVITWLFLRAARAAAATRPPAVAILAAFSVGALDEWIQHLAPGRIGEVRDIFLNLAAIVSGLLISLAVARSHAAGRHSNAAKTPLVTTALLAATLVGSFLWAVHCGHVIADAEVEFRSRYDLHELRARSDDLHAASRTTAFGIENQYMTEALWHVQARNELWNAGDIRAAWAENRILETYFASALAAGHAWPPAQRADAAERRGAAAGDRYRSHAARLWIFECGG